MDLERLAFFLIAPQSQIDAGIFGSLLKTESLRDKVEARVRQYLGAKDAWFDEWFEPHLNLGYKWSVEKGGRDDFLYAAGCAIKCTDWLTVFGDILFLALDLSVENLPTGSRLRLGRALLEVTVKPHNGCRKFAARFGHDALRLVANPQLRHRNLRGIYLCVVEAGEVAVGDAVAVVSRPD